MGMERRTNMLFHRYGTGYGTRCSRVHVPYQNVLTHGPAEAPLRPNVRLACPLEEHELRIGHWDTADLLLDQIGRPVAIVRLHNNIVL